jgi:hypothetical protein
MGEKAGKGSTAAICSEAAKLPTMFKLLSVALDCHAMNNRVRFTERKLGRTRRFAGNRVDGRYRRNSVMEEHQKSFRKRASIVGLLLAYRDEAGRLIYAAACRCQCVPMPGSAAVAS